MAKTLYPEDDANLASAFEMVALSDGFLVGFLNKNPGATSEQIVQSSGGSQSKIVRDLDRLEKIGVVRRGPLVENSNDTGPRFVS